ncbi:aldo/keto reductase [Paenibacillus sp. LMG 31456]|uniref:Aldo/keto reductase n=1 Tax=Paenibacillus foliorum TaxID=2654974 RepID=A0A972GZ36_9BACL|nr:aldo/keto reductase [Paenibacillus foliorum]NOU97184.1 aldo/keto reductase [Paenibacillus foliorum]
MAIINRYEIEQIRSAISKQPVLLADGTPLPRLGQGTWNIGDDPSKRDEEIRTLRLGVELGMNLIDTAEMYGEGNSEQLVGEAIKGIRDEVFIVSKVYPHNAGLTRIATSCEASLRRLRTDRLDLYLLHWRGNVPLSETIEGMEKLVQEGKIARWGVSNLDTADMKELLRYDKGARCVTDQVLYHLASRGIEYDLLPLLREHRMPIMAYCPLAQAGSLRRGLVENKALQNIANKYNVTPYQLLLAWCTHEGDVIAIPKASSEEHVVDNAQAIFIDLSEEDIRSLDAEYAKPSRKMPLDMV